MIQSMLLQWFRKNKRSLPWRRVRDPYAIWISEIMLQQTQVKTVLPYYQRWMRRFPNVRGLAKAPLEEVLKHWEGLGYYRRARNLHQTAQIVSEKRGGKFPDSSDELQKLPGVGRYTAGAIASIAFGKPEPILDGNVTRVLARVFAVKDAVDQTSGKKKLWEIATQLVRELFVRHCEEAVRPIPRPSLRVRRPRPYGPKGPEGRRTKQSRGLGTGSASSEIASASFRALPRNDNIGEFNQALMELGALVCLPENPKCFVCPLKKVCKAHRIHRENEFPVKAQREKTEKLKTVAAVLWKRGRILLQKQPLHARWGGLWLFPQWTLKNGKSEEVFLKEKIRQELGIRIEKLQSRMQIQHGFTKYRVRLKVYEGEVDSTPSVIARQQSKRSRSNLTEGHPERHVFECGKAASEGSRDTFTSRQAAVKCCLCGPSAALRPQDDARRRIASSLPAEGTVKGILISPDASGVRASSSADGGLLAMTYWVEPGNLSRFPLPSPHQKIAQMIQSHA